MKNKTKLKSVTRSLVFIGIAALALTACQVAANGYLTIDSPANIEMHRGQFRVFSATRDGSPAANAEWTISGALFPVNEFTTVVDGFLFIAYGELNDVLELEVVSGRESLTINVNVLDTGAYVNLPEALIFPWPGRFDIAAGTMTSLNAEYFGGWIDWKWEIAGEPHAGIGIVGSQLVVFGGTPEVTAMVRAFDPDNPGKTAYATFTVREPEITGVIVEGQYAYRGEENFFFANIARSGPVVSAEWPIWEWSISPDCQEDLHAETGFRDGQWGDRVLFIHEDEAAETITIRAKDFATGRYGDRQVLIQDKLVPLVTLSPSGFINVDRGSSTRLTAEIADGIVFGYIMWNLWAWGFPTIHPDTRLVPVDGQPLSRDLYVSASEIRGNFDVSVQIGGAQLLDVDDELLTATVFVTVVDP